MYENEKMYVDLRAKQEAEAIERMKLLELHPQVIRDFVNESVLHKSEGIGYLYCLNEDEMKMVKDFEDKYHALVYHAIKSFSPYGTMFAMLYVSDREFLWPIAKEEMKNGIQMCYVKNLDFGLFSECGYIGFKKSFGGLMRTA